MGKREELDDPASSDAVAGDGNVVFWASFPEFVRAAVKKHKTISEHFSAVQKQPNHRTCLLVCSHSCLCGSMAINQDLYLQGSVGNNQSLRGHLTVSLTNRAS